MGHYPKLMTPYMTTRKSGYSFQLLFKRWKASVYKLVWRDLVIWLVLYYAFSLWYRFGMNAGEQKTFERFCKYCSKSLDFIPLSFVLGFYVSLVVGRWWTAFDMLPWTDNVALFVTTGIPGHDERSRMMRRTIMRYLNLAAVYSMALVSTRVRKRFPTLDYFIAAGLMNENERKILEDLTVKKNKLYYLPLIWAAAIITTAREEGIMKSEMNWRACMDHLVDFRQKCGSVVLIDIINVPLVYSQVVALSVYTYFLASLFAQQFLLHDKENLDLVFPFFSALQFVFYIGWLKVAESLIHPFGEDDEDFELNAISDYNLATSFMVADEIHSRYPDVVKDLYWDDVVPKTMPHTEESQEIEDGRDADILGSLVDVPVSVAACREWESKMIHHRRKSTVRRLFSTKRRSTRSAASRRRGLTQSTSEMLDESSDKGLSPIPEEGIAQQKDKKISKTLSWGDLKTEAVHIHECASESNKPTKPNGAVRRVETFSNPRKEAKPPLDQSFTTNQSAPSVAFFTQQPGDALKQRPKDEEGITRASEWLERIVEAPKLAEVAANLMHFKKETFSAKKESTPMNSFGFLACNNSRCVNEGDGLRQTAQQDQEDALEEQRSTSKNHTCGERFL